VPERPADVTSLLAVYGTLRRGYRNHPLIERGSRFVGLAHLPGRLVHISSPLRRYSYPGYLPDTPGTSLRVLVEVVEVTDASLWTGLDALERYLPDDPGSSEYRRVLATASMTDGRALTCWTYRYNSSVAGYQDVPDGDWTSLRPASAEPDVTGP
jgi:gamma-glutamylcyclotransferase (GGCT)/AIG2-like uncharacterized protein YtfP